MLFSIITPCRNAALYIEQTIYSVLAQAGDFSLEYIVIDGASSDQTHPLVDSVIKKLDDGAIPQGCKNVEVRIVSETDSGMYDALAKGISLARGDVISYLNAGDYYLDGALQTVASIFQNNRGINWLSGYRLKVNDGGGVIRCQLPLSYSSAFIQKSVYGRFLPFIHQESTFARRCLYDRVDLERLASFQYAGDHFLWDSFARHDKLCVINALLAVFRKHDNQLSSDMSSYLEEVKRICNRKLTVLDWPLVLIHLIGWQLPAELKLKLNADIITPG